MKIKILFALLLACGVLFGQKPDPQTPATGDPYLGGIKPPIRTYLDACNPEPHRVISTNPAAPRNSDCNGDYLNANSPNTYGRYFDWTGQPCPNQFCPIDWTFGTHTVMSPFSPFQQNTALSYLYDGTNIPGIPDIHPEDGWELLRAGSQNDAFGNLDFRYVLLYNRYTGMVRVLGNQPHGSGTEQDIVISLYFDKEANQLKPTTAAILFPANAKAQTMHDKALVSRVSKTTLFPTGYEDWFHADFQVGYDPCVCHYASKLKVEFATVLKQSVSLYSRAVQATQSLASIETNGPVVEDDQFLTNFSVNADGSVQGANMVFNSFEAAGEHYRDIETRAAAIEDRLRGYEDFKTFCEGAGTLFEVAGAVASLAGPEAEEFAKGMELGAKGMEAIGKISDYESAPIRAELNAARNEQNLLGAVSIAHSEMTTQGTISTRIVLSHGINIRTPGALALVSPCNPSSYPMYDAPLGRLAVLNKPTYNERFSTQHHRVNHPGPYHGDPNIEEWDDTVMEIGLTAGLEYTLNPALDWDLQNTRINAALYVEVLNEHTGTSSWDLVPPDDAFSGQGFTEVMRRGDTIGFISTFVPIECAENFRGTISNRRSGFRILQTLVRVAGTYAFQSVNSVGHRNVSTELLTYHTERAASIPTVAPITSYPNVINGLSVGTNYSGPPITLFAWEQINITQNISANAGSIITIIAPVVHINPGVVIGQNIHIIKQNYPYACHGRAYPNDRLISFCNAPDGYHGFESNDKTLPIAETESSEGNLKNIGFTAAPNPFNEGGVRIDFGLEQAGRCMVTVHDALGKQVAVLLSTDTAAEGPQQLYWDAAGAPVGIYFVTLHTEQGRQSIKVSKQ